MRFIQDLRYAFRNLGKSPGFLLLAAATLGLGISANTAIFSLFYQVLLRSLPVRDPEQLAVLHVEKLDMPGSNSSDNYETVFSYPMYRAIRDRSHSFQGVAARSGESLQLLENGSAERVRSELVSGNFFQVLELGPAAGRLFSQSDDHPGAGNPVVVLSYAYWMKHFGGEASAIGRSVTFNQKIFSIAGVAPEGFRGVLSGNSPDLYMPLSLLPAIDARWKTYDRPNMSRFNLLVRLNPGVSRERAEAELAPLFAATIQDELVQMKVTSAATRKRLERARMQLVPSARGLNQLEKQWKKPLIVLACMVGLLLLIGCANLANLLLARGVNRSRDTAIRLALGASRSRIASLLLAESLLVALAGALLGVALTPALAAAVLSLLPTGQSGGWLSGGLNIPVLLFCTALMVVTGLVSGLAPAWQSSRTREGSVLADRSASSGGHLSPRVRQGLVVGQLALSLVLLSTAGLFGRSLLNLMKHDPGFHAENLLSFSLNASDSGYTAERGLVLYDQLLKRLASQPGVQAVSMADIVPLSDSDEGTDISIEGYTAADGENTNTDTNAVSAGYFRTLGTHIVAGREFTDRDTAGADKVAVVNEAFVKRFISGQSAGRNPVGMKMSRGSGRALNLQIVGVVQDLQNMSLRDSVKPAFYVPYAQSKTGEMKLRAAFLVRTQGDPAAMTSAVREIVSQLDRSLPIFDVETMPARVDDSIYTDRLLAALTSAFGALAMLLTAVGLYGVIAYVVSRRTAEFGIRMALGATQGDVTGLVLREVALLGVLGIAGGLLLSFAASRAVQTQLFDVKGIDPLILAATIVMLGFVSLLAGAVPAIRAARIQPLVALRHD